MIRTRRRDREEIIVDMGHYGASKQTPTTRPLAPWGSGGRRSDWWTRILRLV